MYIGERDGAFDASPARSANGADAAAPGSVTGFRVHRDGRLAAIGSVSDLPAGAQGIAVR